MSVCGKGFTWPLRLALTFQGASLSDKGLCFAPSLRCPSMVYREVWNDEYNLHVENTKKCAPSAYPKG